LIDTAGATGRNDNIGLVVDTSLLENINRLLDLIILKIDDRSRLRRVDPILFHEGIRSNGIQPKNIGTIAGENLGTYAIEVLLIIG
jgi:hypothetical protein